MNQLTPEQIEKSRAEFESIFTMFDLRLPKQSPYQTLKDEIPIYEDINTNLAWCGWLRRQQTLVVELPSSHYFDNQDFDGVETGELIKSLEVAGINYK